MFGKDDEMATETYDQAVATNWKRIREYHFKKWADKGTNLSPKQVEFLRDTSARDWTWSKESRAVPIGGKAASRRGRPPGALSKRNVRASDSLGPARSSRKMEVKRKLRAGLADLAALSFSTAPNADGLKVWFAKADATEVLNKDDLLTVISYAVNTFGEEYADAIFALLGPFYSRRGFKLHLGKDAPGEVR